MLNIGRAPSSPGDANLQAFYDAQLRSEERFAAAIDAFAKAASRGHSDDEGHHDRVHAITGIKIEAQIPVLQDWDMDLDRHLAEFQNVLDCHASGRRSRVRDWDKLT